MAALEAEHDNLRAALEWSLEIEPESGLRIGVALLEFWDAHGHLSEARQWMDRLLSASNVLSPTRAGLTVQRDSHDERAVPTLLEGLALALASAPPVDLAVHLLGAAEALRGRIGLARMEVERAGYERARAALRARLDGPAFAVLWTEGLGLSTTQVIELALHQP